MGAPGINNMGAAAILGDTGNGGAIFDAERRYRYRLWRDWAESPRRVLFIMLNPSTADEETLDPTILRCIGFAKEWEFDGIEVVNLFSWRSTDPRELSRVADPVGPENDEAIATALRDTSLAIAAWGDEPVAHERALMVRRLAARLDKQLFCLGTTQSGQPRHPLYVVGATRPQLLF
jgi:hypothetical protein